MAQFPFAKPKETIETPVDVDVTVAETPAVDVTVAEDKPKKARKITSQPTTDQMRQIMAMIKTSTYAEIAKQTGLAKEQVNHFLVATKKKLKKACAGDPAKLAKIDAFIAENMSRPKDSLPGKKKSTTTSGAMDSIVNDILNSLG